MIKASVVKVKEMNRKELLNSIQKYLFYAVELNLYLDTHPSDQEVNSKLNDYKKQSEELRNRYQEMYGPLTSETAEDNRWGWIADPWPWNLPEEGEN